jgi:lipopolysaccharide export LptBFGC system permease protein LptF
LIMSFLLVAVFVMMLLAVRKDTIGPDSRRRSEFGRK